MVRIFTLYFLALSEITEGHFYLHLFSSAMVMSPSTLSFYKSISRKKPKYFNFSKRFWKPLFFDTTIIEPPKLASNLTFMAKSSCSGLLSSTHPVYYTRTHLPKYFQKRGLFLRQFLIVIDLLYGSTYLHNNVELIHINSRRSWTSGIGHLTNANYRRAKPQLE